MIIFDKCLVGLVRKRIMLKKKKVKQSQREIRRYRNRRMII